MISGAYWIFSMRTLATSMCLPCRRWRRSFSTSSSIAPFSFWRSAYEVWARTPIAALLSSGPMTSSK